MTEQIKDEKVQRWVASWFNPDPAWSCRIIAGTCQGQFTYETEEEAGKFADAMRANGFMNVYGKGAADSLAPVLANCWPNHFDPVGPILAYVKFHGDEIVPDHLRGIYEAPFSHDGMFNGTYIYDGKHNTVADMRGAGLNQKAFQARGFGRFKYMDDGVRLHDEMEAFFQRLIPKGSYAFSHADAAVAALNHAWRPKT
jgi:hypothetical protein